MAHIVLPLKCNPVSLLSETALKDLIFQYAAVLLDGSGRGDVILVADHQNTIQSQLAAFIQGQTNHLGTDVFTPLQGQDTGADMAAAAKQLLVEVMADIHCTDEEISILIQAKKVESGTRPWLSSVTSRLARYR